VDRWTLPSFDALPSERSARAAKPAQGVQATPTAASPTVDEVQAIVAAAHKEAFARGLQEGLKAGQAQGEAMGREEGIEKGRTEGFQTGYQQGYQSGAQEVERMANERRQVLKTLSELPQTLETLLPEWVYETALRLAGKEQMDRAVFVSAVQEALMRLPRPGETLIVGVPPQEKDSWEALLHGPDMPFQAVVRVDADLLPGFAYVQADGTRLDVGSRAREALVRSALGLLPQQTSGPS
jgi:flagellar biosynthesis/type III secretory pathway protein FliH